MNKYKKGHISLVFFAWFAWGELLEYWGVPIASGSLLPFLAWAHCSYIIVQHYITVKE